MAFLKFHCLSLNCKHVYQVVISSAVTSGNRPIAGVLKDYFSMFGEVRSAVVMFDKKTGRHRGYGFVDFKDKDSFNAAIAKDSHVLENSRLLLAEGQQRTAGRQQPL